MSFTSRKKLLKPPESMAQIVALMVLLKSDVRMKANAHIVGTLIPNSQGLDQYEIGSSHPQNPRTVVIAPFMMKDMRRRLFTIAGVTLVRRQRTVEVLRENYTLEQFDLCVSDLIAYMDTGDLNLKSPTTVTTQGKGVTPT